MKSDDQQASNLNYIPLVSRASRSVQ